MSNTALGPSLETVGHSDPTKRMNRNWSLFSALPLVFIGLVFMAPVGFMLSSSFLEPNFGFQNFSAIFMDSGYRRILLQTIEIAAIATGFTLLLGYPIAYLIVTSRKRYLKVGLLFVVVGAHLTNIMTRLFAWVVLLGKSGPVSQMPGSPDLLFTKWGTVIGLVQILMPFMVLPLVTILRQIDQRLMSTAETLGAGRAQRFSLVYFPMSLPGITVSSALVFVYAIGAFAIPAVLGGQKGTMVSVTIYQQVNETFAYGVASALSVLTMIAVTIVLVLLLRLMRGSLLWVIDPQSIAERSTSPRIDSAAGPQESSAGTTGRRHSHSPQLLRRVTASVARGLDRSKIPSFGAIAVIFGCLIAVFMLGPQIVAIQVSFTDVRSLIYPPPSYSLRWYEEYFTAAWLMPTLTSVIVALAAVLLALPIAIAAALAATRSTSKLARISVIASMAIPLVLPHVVTANALFVAFLRVDLHDTYIGMILGHTVIVAPFVFGIAVANLQAIDKRLEQTAESLGAGVFSIVFRIILPQIKGGIALASALAFLVSFDESVVGVFLSGIDVTTLPARIFGALIRESNPTIGAVGTLMLLVFILASMFYALIRLRTRKDERR